MSGGNFIDRYMAGARPEDFTPEEAQELADRLIRTDAYRDAKHIDHAPVSREVQRFFQRIAPGTIGPSGEVIR